MKPTAISNIREQVARAFSGEKAYNVAALCERYGLAPANGDDPMASKMKYIVPRLTALADDAVLTIAREAVIEFPDYHLQEALFKHDEASAAYRITELTRQRLAEELDNFEPLAGRVHLTDFLRKFWPIDELQPSGFRFDGFEQELGQHMVLNDDWHNSYLLQHVGFFECSQHCLFRFLEELASPLLRDEPAQQALVDAINPVLARDGFVMKPDGYLSGSPTFRVQPLQQGVAGSVKNIIFASTGAKPDLVLADAINNDVAIVRHAEHCLIYDLALPPDGLRWKDLIAWWRIKHPNHPDDDAAERDLYKRLYASLRDSEAERIFFRTYFSHLRPILGEQLPALIPQVYLHYDPFSMRELARQAQEQRLPRQRMDFLMLLPHRHRIVLEIDGKHHYADDDRANTSKYAAMVKADRDLRLLGYEIYRFGGHEFTGDGVESSIAAFFQRLFRKYSVLTN